MEYKIEAKGNELFDSQSGGNGKKNIDPVEIKIELTMSKKHYESIKGKLTNAILKVMGI